MDDGLVTDIKRGRAARNAKLASLPVGMAGRAALGFGKRLTGVSKDEVNAELMDKAAQQLFTVLGELKGGAMKVGQALSVMEAAIPEQYGKPYREALTKLQREAPPLPAAKVHRVLDGQLGTKWRERFASFDDTPVASASIGQVHKAVWSDGREVAVKIQYPGADEALRADLKTMKRMVSVIKQLSPGADVQGVVDEMIERTEMELDYRLEAENQRAFAKAYEGHPHFVVPHIVASAPKVVIQEWIEGIPLSVIIREGTPEQREGERQENEKVHHRFLGLPRTRSMDRHSPLYPSGGGKATATTPNANCVERECPGRRKRIRRNRVKVID